MASALMATLKASAGVAVTYHRNDTNGSFSVEITATRGRSDLTLEDGALALQVQTSDWIIEAADLLLNGVVVVPQRNDFITLAISSTVTEKYQIFEVPYRPCDPAGRVLRIHTTKTE